MTPRIDRANLRKCVACGNYHPLSQLVGQTFRAGKHRFWLCLPCWRKDTAPVCCEDCGEPITTENANFRIMPNGGYRLNSARCITCANAVEKRNKLYADLARRYPSVLNAK